MPARRVLPYHLLRFMPSRAEAPYCLRKSLATLLKRALIDGRIKRSGKEEHLLSWPFLGKIPEATRIGDR